MSNHTKYALMTEIALTPPAQGADVPEWIHLLPTLAGAIRTVDGRGPYSMAAAEDIISASFNSKDALEVDINHSTFLAARNGGRSDAVGWIVEMQARKDGIWGKVDWTKAGAALVAEKAYRRISPALGLDPTNLKKVISLLNVSLVNRANLHGLTALNQQQENQMDWIKFLAGLLALKDDATEDQIKSALKKKLSAKTAAGDGDKGDEGKKALQSQLGEIGAALGLGQDVEAGAILAAVKLKGEAGEAGTGAIIALQSEIADLTTQLNSVSAAQSKDKATAFVDGEIKKGRAGVKPLRDHYIAMHMQDALRVEKEIGALPVLSGSGALATPPEIKDGKIALNSEQANFAKMLGVDPDAYAKTLAQELTEQEAI